MEQVLLHEHRAKKEGVTLVEALVAIAIVVIISVATTSVVIYSTNTMRNMTVKRFFQNEVDSISTLYLTYDGSDFSDAMSDFCGVNQSSAIGETIYYYNGAFEKVELETNWEYKLILAFDVSSLSLSSVYKSGGSIYSRSVSK